MGAFYGSIHIRTENSDAVQEALEHVAKQAKCKFLMGPVINGWISIFPDDSGQNESLSATIAVQLANDIFHLLVHDDDIFAYFFYRDGRLLDQYNSDANYFEEASEEEKQQSKGRPELFQELLRKPESLGELKTLLAADKEKYAFEQERMQVFVKLLGLSNALSSYEYLQEGERDEIKGWKQFIHIPDLAAEKAAKRAAQAQIKVKKKQLQKEGILLTEITAPKKTGPGLPNSAVWGTDSTNGGLLLSWRSYYQQSAAELFLIRPPWDNPPQPSGLKVDWTVHNFCMSPSGNWLAGEFGAGDWKMRVWDWERKELLFEGTHTSAVGWVEFSKDEQLVYSLGGGEFIVTSMKEKRPIITVKGLEGARTAAVHPSGKFAVVTFQLALGVIDLEKGQLAKRLVVNRRMKSLEQFSACSEEMILQACVKAFVQNPKIAQKFCIGPELSAALLKDAKAIEQLSVEGQQVFKAMVDRVRFPSFETKENLFDVRFHPNGERLFVAGSGMRVFDWNKLLSANEDAPAPEFSVDAPKDDENDPNSHPLAYSVRFDSERNLLLSSCLAGVIQYLNVNTGQSGVLLKPPDEMGIWRLEFTCDKRALCCHCTTRPRGDNLNKRSNWLQIWNYPALCKAAGLD
jgi:WD40 repeat protein